MASFKTIYRWLYAGKLFHYQAGQKNVLNTRVLRQKGMRSSSSMREVIAATGGSIHNRPPEVENRSEFGHWEVDTVVSPPRHTWCMCSDVPGTPDEAILRYSDAKPDRSSDEYCDTDFRRLIARWGSSFAQRRSWQGICDVYLNHQSPADQAILCRPLFVLATWQHRESQWAVARVLPKGNGFYHRL
jgi:hypothetical protein